MCIGCLENGGVPPKHAAISRVLYCYTGCFKKSFTTLKAYRNIQYHVHERDFFFLWGFVKDRLFVPNLPANVVELRTRITAAVAKSDARDAT